MLLKFLVLLAIIVLFQLGLKAQHQEDNNREISPEFVELSKSFKLKIGLNRINEFEKLSHLIKPKTQITQTPPNYNYYIGDFTTTLSEIITLLGEPDIKISNTIYQYNLGTNSTACKVYIGIDADGFVTYSVIKSCN